MSTNKEWSVRIHIVSYYGEITVEQRASGGNAAVREDVFNKATKLLGDLATLRSATEGGK